MGALMMPGALENILVIGGNGFIGRSLVPRLALCAGKVTVLSRSGTGEGYAGNPGNVSHVKGDFGDAEALLPLLDSHDTVIHLAYATVPNTSFDNPMADLTKNLVPAVSLFSEAARRGCFLVLISSGGTVYGEPQVVPLTEDQPMWPVSPYGVTKLTLEHYAHLYSVTHGLKYLCIRPANPYGPGQKPFVGQGFVATAIGSALRGKAVEIYGEHGAIRDYIFIDDLAAGIAELTLSGAAGRAFNLGSGVGRSNEEVVAAIRAVIRSDGLTLSIVKKPQRPFDVTANILDCSRAHRLTGWKPVVSFEEGVKRTYEWLRAQYG